MVLCKYGTPLNWRLRRARHLSTLDYPTKNSTHCIRYRGGLFCRWFSHLHNLQSIIMWTPTQETIKWGCVLLQEQVNEHYKPIWCCSRSIKDVGRTYDSDYQDSLGGALGPTTFLPILWVPASLNRQTMTFKNGFCISQKLPTILSGSRFVYWTEFYVAHAPEIHITLQMSYHSHQPSGRTVRRWTTQ